MSQSDIAPDEDVRSVPAHLMGMQEPDFAEDSYLTYLIPSSTDLDLDKAFKDLEPGKTILDSIQQRESLFFG